MGFFNPTPEERAEKERQRLEKEKRRRDEAFAASPAGQARAAKAAGMKIFQIDVPLSWTKGYTVAMVGAFTDSTKTSDYSRTIQAIEEEGWRLDHVGYVYRITGSESRDKFLASGQQEAVSGEIIGIYMFRAE
ncbi:MAG: hypothetical protein F9K13_12830 [Candidatus Methylomirabilis oxygeniifera]|uniref:Uncharacterized protein n=1 Tax=Methylomirabilis oxygeniifera TaxID=671143 RepID=D5MI30_METO1|nr:MAG: hypothetical protein F9K13_12830 [Candidatus Methylomirabilis oxyfera]CBE69323.1 protein of unknown function [Candidatus Methylomirabilis oxyfera]